MPNMTTLMPAVLATTFALGSVAIAQDSEWVTPEPSYDHFALSDANADGGLDRTEFEIYVSARADAGDADYVAIRDSGDLDSHFTEKDVNADGLIDKDEVTPIAEPDSYEVTPEPTEEPVIMEEDTTDEDDF